jgi:hypothetical protein
MYHKTFKAKLTNPKKFKKGAYQTKELRFKWRNFNAIQIDSDKLNDYILTTYNTSYCQRATETGKNYFNL